MSRYYPIFLDLAGRLCVVVGGGGVAERKVVGLLEAGARVRVVSPEITPTLRDLADRGEIEYQAVGYRTDLLDGAHLVFAATSVRTVNAQVGRDASALNLPAAVADAPEEGSFVVPAVVRRGEFCLAISTGGDSPMLAARLADEMEQRFGPEFGAYVELLGVVRDTIKGWTNDLAARRAAVAAVLDGGTELRAHLAAGRTEAAFELALSIARTALENRE